MNIHIERDKKTLKMQYSGTGLGLLERLKINPETILLVKNGSVVTEREHLDDDDEVKILSVISGG